MERKERRHFTREFKLEAVRLAAAGDKTKAKVTRELGIWVNLLRLLPSVPAVVAQTGSYPQNGCSRFS
jgi:hypothetical protein